MRKRRRLTSGLSLGTVAALALLGLVIAGCVLLLPKLIGNIDLRVDSQRVGVAIESAFFDRNLTGNTQGNGSVGDRTEVTLPPELPPTEPTATPVAEHTITMTAAGVIAIDSQIQKACTSEAGYAFGPLWEHLAGSLNSEINLATLENLVIATEKLTDINMPGDALTAIRESGFNAISSGFYGVLNSGVSGLNATLNAIGQNGMTAYGAYASAESRRHVVTVDLEGVTVALLSFQGELSAAGKKKTTKEEQAFAIAPLTLPTISAEIKAAQAAGAQIVVVSLCWGKEGATTPSTTQRELAQGIANAGADIILGSHSGTLQPIEILNAIRADGSKHETLCAYSLGNLLESDRGDRAGISGALLHMTMRYRLADDHLSFESLTYTPTYVWRGKTDGRTGYRVLRSNAVPPDFVESDQQGVMERSLTLVRGVFADSPVSEAP